MRAVRGINTAPEKLACSKLHGMGFRFRKHGKTLPGRPDIVLPRWKAVVFINGCFWHRHKGCKLASEPKHNSVFWTKKFKENVLRDRKVQKEIHDMGWRCFILWECELKKTPKKIIEDLSRNIKKEDKSD